MCPYEVFALVASISMLVIVYVPAMIILGKCSVHAIWKRTHWQSSTSENAILCLAAAGLILFGYSYFIEPYWVEVTKVRIQSSKLANHNRPIRVVQISDLHCDPTERAERALPGIIAAQHPDVIVFTGDTINSRPALGIFKNCLRKISDIAPTFVVEGNHDARCWSDLPLFKNTKATALNGAAKKMVVRGQELYIAGVGFDSAHLVSKALHAVPSGAFTLFLYHSPDLIQELSKYPVDLVCAGHTHGGQVCLPFYGALVTQSKFGKQFEAGLYKFADSWMYVNRGIGMEGGINFRIRFLARPEVTVIDLDPQNPQTAETPGLRS